MPMDTTLQKWGNSLGIRIPKPVLDSLHWGGDDSLSLRVEGEKLILERKDKRKTIQELFDGFEGEYTPEEVDWGEPAGKEVW